MSQLFKTKSLARLVGDTEEPGQTLKRTLGPVQLTALGIGAIIGAGIFSTVGTAAAGGGEHIGAGPAVALSFVLTAIACGFAALCYAEFAAMVPVAGSAYTYAYATLGELIAWIIGWDLILEYADRERRRGGLLVRVTSRSCCGGWASPGRRGSAWTSGRPSRRASRCARRRRPTSTSRRSGPWSPMPIRRT